MTGKRWIISGAVAAIAIGLVTVACTPLRSFDALVPKDAGSAKVAGDVPYGAGPRRMLDVYAPVGTKGAAKGQKSLPVVVFFYGGSWASGTRTGYGFAGRALAAQGFVVVIPDYRIGPETVYPGFVEDGAAAVRWIEAHIQDYGGDPARIVLSGHSAGAYIGAMLAVDDRWLGKDRGAVKGFVGLAGPYDFAPFDVPVAVAAFGAWSKPQETQPIHWAGAGDPPVLLLTGSDDRVVEPRNSVALGAKLRAAGVEATERRYSGLGHVGIVTALARPLRGKAPVLMDMAAFVRRVAG